MPMALYKHVANKEELLDGMVDIVFSEIELPSADLDWRSAMRRRAISTREALKRHSWAIGMMESRHPGPANLRNHNAVMGCLRKAGFSFEMAIHAYSRPGRLHLRLRPAGKGYWRSRPPTVPEKPRRAGRRRSARSRTTRTSSRSPRSSPSPGTTTPSSSHGGSTSSSTASSGFAAKPESRAVAIGSHALLKCGLAAVDNASPSSRPSRRLRVIPKTSLPPVSTTDLSTNGNKAVEQQTSEPIGEGGHERTLTVDLP